MDVANARDYTSRTQSWPWVVDNSSGYSSSFNCNETPFPGIFNGTMNWFQWTSFPCSLKCYLLVLLVRSPPLCGRNLKLHHHPPFRIDMTIRFVADPGLCAKWKNDWSIALPPPPRPCLADDISFYPGRQFKTMSDPKLSILRDKWSMLSY